MNYIKEKIKDFYLLDSKVENIFINEYMPEAPGDYVKVFIYAQMYAEYGLDMSNETMAKQLGITEKKVLDAWTYWEKIGAVRKHYIDNSGDVEFTVEFLNLKEFLYGKNRTPVPAAEESKSEDNIFGNENVKKMFSEVEKKFGRGLSSTEISTIMSWLTDYSATPEVVLYGVDYCVQKNKLSIRYIETIIRKWTELGLNTVDQVADYLHQMDERFYQYKRVLNALGFTRNATEAEKRMMDNWFDGMGFSMDRVLDACGRTAGISNPNFNYVNKVLENWNNGAPDTDLSGGKTVATQALLNQYYEYLRQKAESEAEQRTAEVYSRLPRIEEIDNETRRLGMKLSKALISDASRAEAKKIQNALDELSAERAVTLTDNNFEMDYTDVKYACDKCNDTGITDIGERCSCIKERMEEAIIWQKKENTKDLSE